MLYLDHAATAGRRPPGVIDAIARALREASANPGRSGHRLSIAAARIVEDARWELAELFGAPEPSHVAFTKNATEAINLVLHGFLESGDTVLAGPWEHNAVVRPLRTLERSRGIRVEFLPPAEGFAAGGREGNPQSRNPESRKPERGGDPAGLDLDALRARLAGGGVRLVALSAASNVTGEVFPIEDAARICREAGVFLLVDAAQSAGALPLDLSATPIDAVAVTGHKSLYGPTGTGALIVREPERITPLLQGGTGSRSESEEQPDLAPDRFEAGTPNVCGLAGLAEGIRHVRAVGVEAVRDRHRLLSRRLRAGLARLDGVRVCGPADPDRCLAVVSFVVDGALADEVARALDRREVYCRPGLHCSPRAHRTLGTFPSGTIRFSLCADDGEPTVDAAASALEEVLRDVRR